jgi:hypothetical protein
VKPTKLGRTVLDSEPSEDNLGGIDSLAEGSVAVAGPTPEA